jgi:predicted nucleic acid-binding protein/Arc/MetJ-type ribon-helix-helix transcriptional regulator
MVIDMATRKVTITLDEAQLDRVRGLVDAGSATSVSGFVQHAVGVALDDVAGWGAVLAEALTASGGPLSDEERAWADAMLAGTSARHPAAWHAVNHDQTTGITLDAGALIAFERGNRQVVALLTRAAETGARITLPATVLAQVVRRPERQVGLVRLARQPTTDVIALDRVDATQVGRLLAASGTADIVDAHVVVCANRAGQRVVTSDPHDLARLDPQLQMLTV